MNPSMIFMASALLARTIFVDPAEASQPLNNCDAALRSVYRASLATDSSDESTGDRSPAFLRQELEDQGVVKADIELILGIDHILPLLASGIMEDAVRRALGASGVSAESIGVALAHLRAGSIAEAEVMKLVVAIEDHLPQTLPEVHLNNVDEVERIRNFYNVTIEQYQQMQRILSTRESRWKLRLGIMGLVMGRDQKFLRRLIKVPGLFRRVRTWWFRRKLKRTQNNPNESASPQKMDDAATKHFRAELARIQKLYLKKSPTDEKQKAFLEALKNLMYTDPMPALSINDLRDIMGILPYGVGWGIKSEHVIEGQRSLSMIKQHFSNTHDGFDPLDRIILFLTLGAIKDVSTFEDLDSLQTEFIEALERTYDYAKATDGLKRDLFRLTDLLFGKLREIQQKEMMDQEINLAASTTRVRAYDDSGDRKAAPERGPEDQVMEAADSLAANNPLSSKSQKGK